MTTYVTARNALVGHLHTTFTTAYPAVPVFYENTVEIDMDAQPDMFLVVAIDFLDNQRLDIHADPNTEVFGEMSLRIFTRAGLGVSGHLALFDYLTNLMGHQTLSGVTTLTPFPDKKSSVVGWMMTDLVVPFRFFG